MSQTNIVCAFCDEVADTREHIIPRWLQKHFELKDQFLGLSNGSKIKYSQAIIPACKYCNGERFGRLENRIRQAKATPQDYYIWALKIRYCLALKDSTLLLDRTDSTKGTLLPEYLEGAGVEFIKHTFNSLDDEKFIFNPSPFGSVFLFDRLDKSTEKFDLVDVPPPYWSLSIVLPRHKFLVVLFADRGAVKGALKRNTQWNVAFDNARHSTPELETKVCLFSLLRLQNHLIIPDEVRLVPKGLISPNLPKKLRVREQKMVWYKEMSNYCGLGWQLGEQLYANDSQLDFEKIIRVA